LIAILLVGGMGTRLRPLTLGRPKGLIPVLNRPFLAYQLDLLKEGGVTDAVLAAGRHAREWETALRGVTPKGLKLHFAYEPEPLGTGGAIRFAFDAIDRKKSVSEPVLAFNGDVFFDLDIRAFREFHVRRGAVVTIALTRVDDPSRFGVVKTDRSGRVEKFIEKPARPVGTNMVNAGAYTLSPEWIRTIPRNRPVSIERESFPESLSARLPLYGFPMKGYWNDIGTLATYLGAHRDLLSFPNRWTGGHYLRKSGLRLEGAVRFDGRPTLNGRAVIGRGSRIGRRVTLNGFVCLAPGVSVGDGAELTDVVILENTRIGAGTRAQSAIIGRRCRIGNNAEIKAGAALGDGTILTDHTKI
jgi:NDP-sugar pyrophosphorylase family protein